MSTFAVSGIEKIRYAPASNVGVVAAGAWKDMPNIAVGTVAMTKNNSTRATLKKEDGSGKFGEFFTPGDGDTLTIGLLEQNPDLVQELFNVDYDATTTLLEYGAEEKIANLALELTTRVFKDNRKCIITIYNTQVQTGYTNNLTIDAVEQLALTAAIGEYRKSGDTKNKVYTKQWVTANGTPIDSTVSAPEPEETPTP